MNLNTIRPIRVAMIFALVFSALAIVMVTSRSANAATTYSAPSNASRIAAGDGFLCMAAGTTTVYCSGLNDNGQLGDGTTTNRNSLTPITTKSKINNPKAVAVGRAHACAIAGLQSDAPGTGTVYCWGDNTFGQLGNGTNTDSSSPAQVSNNGSFTNSGITGLIAGDDHTCAVMTSNKLFCWGLNGDGQLGDGTQVNKNIPTAVGGVFTAGTTQAIDNWYPWVAAGARHTCAALAVTNRVYCWGDNSSGQLGDGSTTSSSTPVDTGTTGGTPGVANTYKSPLAAGEDFTCSRDSGSLKCWGDNTAGQLGDGTTSRRLVPTAVTSSTGLNQADVWSIAAGGQTACAISNTSGSSNYTVWCWGANNAGQVGDNTTTNRNTPTKVADNSASSFDNESAALKPSSLISNPWGLTVARSVGDGFACVTMWCWGKNNAGQLAQGNTTDSALPVRVGIATVTADPATGATATAVLADTKVTLTLAGLPASTVTRVYYKITPQSFDMTTPRFGMSYTDYQSVNLTGANVPTVSNNTITVAISKMVLSSFTGGQPPTNVDENFTVDGAYHVWFIVEGSATAGYPDGWVFRNLEAPSYETLKVTGAAAPTTTMAPATTAAPTTTAAPATTVAATTTTVANVFAAAKPGVTVTDTKVYTAPPTQVAASSAIIVLSAAQNKVMDIQTKTPAVCLPNDDDLVFIDEGKCVAEVVNAKTRAVLRTLKTTVIADDISEVKVGNEIVTLAPIYFDVMSSNLDAKAMGRLRTLKARISAAGSVLIVGHAGTLNGNSPANVAISKARAESTLAALKSIGAQGPFAVSGVGALDPASTGKTEAAQAKNRRVVIALVP